MENTTDKQQLQAAKYAEIKQILKGLTVEDATYILEYARMQIRKEVKIA